MEKSLSPQETARLLVKIHSEFGCDWYLQNEPAPLSSPLSAPPVAQPAAPVAAHSHTPAAAAVPSPKEEETVLGAVEARKLAQTAADKAQSLEELRTSVQNFKGCESLSRTATQAVFSDGVADSQVMIIGEAPGAEEDRQGKPFVGASGQLLDTMLSFIGLRRSDNFYITNTVFWRPPGNRQPSDNEILICEPFVHKHIALFQPKILLLVGSVSVKNFFKASDGISKLRGTWGEYSGGDYKESGATIPMLATFHPAYLLRNPTAKKHVWQDLRSFKARMTTLGIT